MFDQKEVNANIEIFKRFDDFIKNRLNRNCKILDIGFGAAKFSYRMFHKHSAKDIYGFEILSKNEIESNRNGYTQLLTKLQTINEVESNFNNKLPFYEFYKIYVQYELNQVPLNKSSFEQTFSNLKFKTSFKWDMLKKNQFDLIIASKILHYEEIGSINNFLKQCESILCPQGILYFSYPLNTGRRKISEAEIKNFLKQNTSFNSDDVITINDEEVIFIGRKNGTLY